MRLAMPGMGASLPAVARDHHLWANAHHRDGIGHREAIVLRPAHRTPHSEASSCDSRTIDFSTP